MRVPGLVGGTYESVSPNFDRQRSMNCFPERIESGDGKSRGGLITSARMSAFATGMQGPIRAIFTDAHSFPSEDRMFAIGGGKFYEISRAGVVSERGTVNDDSNHYAAFMASNRPIGSQIAMADGLQGLYVFNLETNAFSGPIRHRRQCGAGNHDRLHSWLLPGWTDERAVFRAV
jgi:hypothetical protein